MKFKFIENKIVLEKELNSLDNFVIDFCSILNKLKIKYVLISGYVSIIFGRNRSSEDIDILIEHLDLLKFKELWNELDRAFECLIINDFLKAYNEYLNNKHALRFSRKEEYLPNMEVKFPKTDIENWCLDNSEKVSLNGNSLFISNLELQISYKLFLGSEKDIEDARYIYQLFKKSLNFELLKGFNRKLDITDIFSKYIGEI